jgi:TusA-related sulfurtransferase
MIIYIIKNKINNKCYIGKYAHCNTLKQFVKSKYWGSGVYLNLAISKHGYKQFSKDVLVSNIKTNRKSNFLEKFWIKKLNSKYPNGYNLTDGGDGLNNPSKEIRNKISKSVSKWHKEIGFSEETRRKISESNKGRKLTKKQRIALLNYNTGRTVSKETREKLRIFNLGTKMSKSTKLKMSRSRKRWYKTEDGKKYKERLKIQIVKNKFTNKGRKHTEETKKIISKANKGKKLSIITKNKMSKSQIGHIASEKVIEVASKLTKERYKNYIQLKNNPNFNHKIGTRWMQYV